jgi:hypothetical protein
MQGSLRNSANTQIEQCYCITALGPMPRSAIGCVAAREVRENATAIACLSILWPPKSTSHLGSFYRCCCLTGLYFSIENTAHLGRYLISRTHTFSGKVYLRAFVCSLVDAAPEKTLSVAGARFPSPIHLRCLQTILDERA